MGDATSPSGEVGADHYGGCNSTPVVLLHSSLGMRLRLQPYESHVPLVTVASSITGLDVVWATTQCVERATAHRRTSAKMSVRVRLHRSEIVAGTGCHGEAWPAISTVPMTAACSALRTSGSPSAAPCTASSSASSSTAGGPDTARGSGGTRSGAELRSRPGLNAGELARRLPATAGVGDFLGGRDGRLPPAGAAPFDEHNLPAQPAHAPRLRSSHARSSSPAFSCTHAPTSCPPGRRLLFTDTSRVETMKPSAACRFLAHRRVHDIASLFVHRRSCGGVQSPKAPALRHARSAGRRIVLASGGRSLSR